MSANRLTDLLPIPEGVSDPHAYQVFGLSGGEQDAVKIKDAVTAVYANLKATKTEADPAAWKQAAKLAEKSKAILLDPQKRATLDARFGVVNVAPPDAPASVPIGVAPTGAPPAADPLAGMLPPANPMAAPVNPMAAPVNSTAAPANPMAPGQPMASGQQQLPPQPYAQAGPMAPAAAPATSVAPKAPQLKVKKTKRRKKSGVGKLLFVLGLCGLAAASAVLGVFVYLGEDIPISKDGKIVAKRASDQKGPAAAPARPVPPRDRVMGSMARGATPPAEVLPKDTGPLTETGLPANRFSTTQAIPDANPGMGMPAGELGMGMPNEPSMPDNASGETSVTQSPDMATAQPEPAMVEPGLPAVNPDEMFPVTPGKESGPAQLTIEQIAANDAEIKKLKELIRSRSWDQMKPAAVAITEKTLSSTQAVEAETLFNLVDLALHYRGGLQRGLESLKSTQTFEVTEGFRVSVVDVTPNSLSVKANGRIYRYGSIEEIKFRLGEKVASFAMDLEKPDTIASKATYQAMAPLSNPEHLTDSIRQLEQINSQLPDVDTKAIAQQLQELL